MPRGYTPRIVPVRSPFEVGDYVTYAGPDAKFSGRIRDIRLDEATKRPTHLKVEGTGHWLAAWRCTKRATPKRVRHAVPWRRSSMTEDVIAKLATANGLIPALKDNPLSTYLGMHLVYWGPVRQIHGVITGVAIEKDGVSMFRVRRYEQRPGTRGVWVSAWRCAVHDGSAEIVRVA